MARIYHNTGSSGREYSKLIIMKQGPLASFSMPQTGVASRDVVLNPAQIADLIDQLIAIRDNKQETSAALPVIEGSIYR